MADTRDAVDFMREVQDAESSIRTDAVRDLKFRYGEQWPSYAVAARGLDRPQLTINETDGYCRQVVNNIRQQRPRINPHPTGVGGSIETAKTLKGLIRHIEVNSSADNAYDVAADYAVTSGTGYFRIDTDYTREDSFDQDIFINPIYNPFTVYFDNNSMAVDGSDAMKCLVTDLMTKEAFKTEYPGAEMQSFSQNGAGDSDADWVTQQDVRVAEYFYIDRIKKRLLKLSTGQVMWEDDPSLEILSAAGIMVMGDRESFKRIVKWQKQTAFEVLEERTITGRWIPIVPVYGVRTFIEGKRDRFGLVRFAVDPQRMLNFWQTTVTEAIALAPKAKWLMMDGQDEGHENDWRAANLSTAPVLRFKGMSLDGTPFVPQRIQPEPPPEGAMNALALATQSLQRVIGMFDPETNSKDPKSGRAIRQERMQSDNSNFHFYDNVTKSQCHAGRIILSKVPSTYDVERLTRIVGDDGKPKMITLNQKQEKDGIKRILNDVRVGEYDIVMETGPGYDTKRQEGVEAMMQLLATPLGEKVAEVGSDLIVRNMDAPGMEALADRLAAASPFSKVDEMEDVPPEQLKTMLAGAQMQIQKLTQASQEQAMQLKYRGDIEKMRQDGETQREHMRSVTKAHDINEKNLSMQHSVEVKAMSDQNVAEINAVTKLLSDKLGINHERFLGVLDHEIALRDQEMQKKINENASEAA